MDREQAPLSGKTIKIKPGLDEPSVYVTVNYDDEGKPWELFLRSDCVDLFQFLTFTAVMGTTLFQRGEPEIIVEHLLECFDLKGGYGFGDNQHNGLMAHIGATVEKLIG